MLLATWASACSSTKDPNAVTLRATQTGVGIHGMHVYFQNADSSVVDSADTDEVGAASADPRARKVFGDGLQQRRASLHVHRSKVGRSSAAAWTSHLRSKAALDVHLAISVEPGRSASDYYVEASSPSLDPVGGEPGAPPSSVVLAAEVPTSFLVTTTDRAISLLATDQQVTPDATIDLTKDAFTPSAARTYHYDTTETPCLVEDYLVLDDSLISTDFSVMINVTRMVAQPALTHLTRVQCSPNARRTFLDWGPFTSDVTRDLSDHLPDVPIDGPELPPDGSWSYDSASRTLLWSELDGTVTPSFVAAVLSPSREIMVQLAGQPEQSVPVSWAWSVVAADNGGSVVLPLLPNDDSNAVDVTVEGASVHVPDLNILDTDLVGSDHDWSGRELRGRSNIV